MLLELQRAFRDMVAGRTDAAAAYIAPGHEARLRVYRNTVQKSLADILAVAFPAVQRIVGEGFFSALARDFARRHPPDVPQLSVYGAGFADFIAVHPKTQDLPYLADVARLEWARGEAYFAADAPTLEPAALSAVPINELASVALPLHPAARLVSSASPVHTIWRVNQPDVADVPPVDMGVAEAVLITRPRYEVVIRALSAPDAVFVAACRVGAGLGEATVAALAADASFDLQTALQDHLVMGTFTALRR